MQVAGTTDKQLQMWMKEMDETSNEIAAPIVDLIFRTLVKFAIFFYQETVLL